MTQRMENWKVCLRRHRLAIERTPGERICRGDLLSQWVKVPTGPVHSVAVCSPYDADDSLLSEDVIRELQKKGVASLGKGFRSFSTSFGRATLAGDDLFLGFVW